MRNIAHFIVVFTFSLSIIAPACGFSWGGNQYSAIEICTANGIETKLVQNEEQPSDTHFKEQCQFCFANTHVDKTITLAISVLKQESDQTKQRFTLYEDTFLSRQSSPISARGPPAFV